MTTSGFFGEHRLAGALMILAFISFAVGATLPIVGEKGNMNIYTLPVEEHLRVVAANAVVWKWANVLMGAAILILLAGLSLFTTILEEANERALSRLGLIAFLVAAILWVIFSAFRAVVTPYVAQEMSANGTVPPYYEALALWGFALFYIYAAVGFLALAAYGAAVLQTGILAAWSGWATIIFSLAMLIVLLVSGDNLPAFHYMPPLLIGILLMMTG